MRNGFSSEIHLASKKRLFFSDIATFFFFLQFDRLPVLVSECLMTALKNSYSKMKKKFQVMLNITVISDLSVNPKTGFILLIFQT